MTNQFIGKSLTDLQALKTAIAARLGEFVEAENAEQTITYRRLLREAEAEIAQLKVESVEDDEAQEALQQAWDSLQSTPSYLEQCSAAFTRFCEAELERCMAEAQ